MLGLAALAATALSGSSQAATRTARPSAASSAVAIRVVVPGRTGAASPAAPPRGGSSSPSFSFPADGAVVISGAASAMRSASLGAVASAASSSRVLNVSIFDGEVTVGSVSTSARSDATATAARGGFGATEVVGLQALGQRITRGSATIGSWGLLTIGRRSSPARASLKAYSASVTGLDLLLLQAHDGLPAGSEIEIAVAAASASIPPPSAPVGAPASGPLPGDRPQLLPPTLGPLLGVPQVIEPTLGPGPYVFPVYGRSVLTDDFGALSASGDYEHAVTISGQLGQPLVAVADGTLFGLGWSRSGGNRLWLRDRQGNEFSYAHLSAFSAPAVEGAHVAAGEVIGFMGATGAVQSQGPALAFEVRPVSLLFLGSQGAVDPRAYLVSWPAVRSIALSSGLAWAPSVSASVKAPEPGATLVASSDISAGGAVGAAALRRSLGVGSRG